ncbi:heavy-metal-associated domain-containing protein [Helicobacter sp.]|uniref:heavy-metal-associated domain-containing protein n=1 Tax=Helicobacter sp. TaxID=218 RepID=UPI0019B0B940|nr:heavy-metal-associated domain-containing protein [Helicobacter sp.]MBD5165869.1 heavy-metal-associated domain-containing protein [Helicobacter sp.]
MEKIQCQNIKCQGCVKKINEALLQKYPSLQVDIASQSVEVEADENGIAEIKRKLQELGFLSESGIFGKLKGFFAK